jgi:hypothetical protein
MRARLLIAALGLACSCGTVRNSDIGSLQNDAGVTFDAGQCTCPRGFCCGTFCCADDQLCCNIGGTPQCRTPAGLNTTCFDFGG